MRASWPTRWNAFWFAPRPPEDLALGRAAFFGLLALLYAPVDWRGWADVDPAMWTPTWSFALLGLPVASADVLGLLQRVWKLALVAASLGVLTRTSITVALVLGFYLLGLPHCFGKVHHYDALLIFIFAILAIGRPGDAYSVDRLWRARQGSADVVAPSGEYTWPIRAIWVVLALVFFGAGVSKVRTSGLAWIFSDGMAIYLVSAQYDFGNAVPLTTLGLVLARHAWLCHALAGATVLLESSYPVALVSRRARALIVPGTLAMQLGLRVLLGPTFFAMMACNVFWIPWSRLLGRDQDRSAAARAAS
jgi:hypothetical protein